MSKPYEAWLSEYTEKLSQMDPVDKAEEERIDYHDSSQAYVDYLDYVDEWNWHMEAKIMETKQRYIFLMGKRHGKIQCHCGVIHTLTTKIDPTHGDVEIDDLTTPLSQQCWYQTIAEKTKQVLTQVNSKQMRLSDPIEKLFLRITRLQLAEGGQTPFLLPFDVFQQVWWNGGNTPDFPKHLLHVITRNEQKELAQVKESCIPEVKRKEILLDFPDSDHGMHALQDALTEHEFLTVLKFVNSNRSKIDFKARRVTLSSLEERRRKCIHCKRFSKHTTGLSIPGVYYAPPGGGKTTTLDRELLVGFDTDWIGIGPNWQTYGQLLKQRIPIITNQPEIFIGSGMKICGIVKKHIRPGADGKPLDTEERIQAWADGHSRNVIIIKVEDKEYMADYAIKLQILHLTQHIIANHTINMIPFYKNEQSEDWAKLFPKILRRKEQEAQLQRRTVLE